MSTGIPYCNETVNATGGCTRIAAGCLNCWAKELHDMRHAAFLAGKHVPRQYAKPFEETQLLFPERLEQVLHWRKPRRIFWCSMSDMFHKNIPVDYIASMYRVMVNTPQHTHLILTKRIERALEVSKALGPGDYNSAPPIQWPENVHFGISCSTQKDLDQMAPVLFQIPAAVRGVSFEPLIEEIDADCFTRPGLDDIVGIYGDHYNPPKKWIIVGCESGPNRRPCNIEWVRSIVRQCKDANVPVYVKQLDINGRIVTDPKDFPKDLRIREYPK